MICKFCSSKSISKNLCRKHYWHLYRYGHILERTSRDPNEIEIKDNICYMKLYKKDNSISAITIFDFEFLSKVKQYKWSLHSCGYVVWKRNNKKILYLHQLILGKYPDNKIEIDHINRNKLDNRKINLRFVNKSENRINCIRPLKYKRRNFSLQKVRCNNYSGYTGVSWSSINKKWISGIRVDGKYFFLGRFKELSEAINARKSAEQSLF